MSALSLRPVCSCDSRWVSLWYLSAGGRYTTQPVPSMHQILRGPTSYHADHFSDRLSEMPREHADLICRKTRYINMLATSSEILRCSLPSPSLAARPGAG